MRSGDASEAPVQSVKPEAPLDLRVATVHATRLFRPFAVAITVSPRVEARRLSLTVRVAGVVRPTGTGRRTATWERVAAGSARDIAVLVVCRRAGLGTAEITGRITPERGEPQIRVVVVDVLAARDEVLAGTAGVQQLQLDHLDHELARQTIDRAQYERKRAAVLGGGATEGP